jgi:hypothetical protein
MGNSLPSAVQARMKVPDLGALPPDLRAEIGRMLQPDPAQRPQSMLDIIGPDASTQVRRASQAAPPGGARSGARPLIAGIAAAVLVLLGGGAFVLKDRLFPAEPGSSGQSASTSPGTAAPSPGPTPSPSTPAAGITPAPPPSPPSPPATAAPAPTPAQPPPASTATASAPPAITPAPPPATSSAPSPPAATQPPAAATVAPPPRHDPSAIRGRLDALIARFDCADLTARVDADLAVRLQGYVESESDRIRLLAAAREIDGVRRIDAGVTVQPWPQCELTRVASAAVSPDFRVVPNKADRPYKIRSDRVSFRVTPPAGRQGYLNLVFVNSDRTTWHHEPWSKIRVRPGQPETFGDKLSITLEPPPGKMAIVAVISAEPLYGNTAPEEQQDFKDYLAGLRRALARQPDAIVAFTVFDTVE